MSFRAPSAEVPRVASGWKVPALVSPVLLAAVLLAGPGCRQAVPPAGDGATVAGGSAGGAGTPAEIGSDGLPLRPEPGPDDNRLKVFLFFQSSRGRRLVWEEQEIFRTESLVDQATQVIELLARGPSGPNALPVLPAEAHLRTFFLVGEDMAVVDLNVKARANHPGGSWAELASIYAIVDSLTFNFPSIRRVKFLINGTEADTLAGHISLRHPFHMDLSMVGSQDWSADAEGARPSTGQAPGGEPGTGGDAGSVAEPVSVPEAAAGDGETTGPALDSDSDPGADADPLAGNAPDAGDGARSDDAAEPSGR